MAARRPLLPGLLPLGVLSLLLSGASPACSRFGAVYPPRPNASAGPAVADPPPSRVVVHVAVTSDAMRGALEDTLPKTGEGTFPLLGNERRYTWERGPLDVQLANGKVVVRTTVRGHVDIPWRGLDLPLDLEVSGEPVVSNRYAVKLQATEVKVRSHDARLALADKFAGVYETISNAIAERLKTFSYDLAPLVGEAYARVAKPMPIPVGEQVACANLSVLGIEAGPTVLADGIEKDIALVVAPSVVLPCAEETVAARAALPPLDNVAAVPSGPFTLMVPVVARYEELTRAMTLAFTDGKLFFSQEYPELYLEKPELYEAQGELVLKLHLHGPIHKMGIDADLDGDLFLSGHPAVVDNELRIPDLEPTIETKNFLLSLKAMTDAASIRDQARDALRLDLGARFVSVREKLGRDLTFGVTPSRSADGLPSSAGGGCVHGEVDRIEVTGVHPHAAYLRVYVAVTARARATMPCAFGPEPVAPLTP